MPTRMRRWHPPHKAAPRRAKRRNPRAHRGHPRQPLAQPATLGRMFIVTLTYIRPVEEIDAHMEAHVAWLRRHYDSGLFVASGRQVPRVGGVILARSGDRAALEAVLAQDPFAQHKLARLDIVEFTPSMTAPGAEALKSI